jgi:hypothetical protein
MRGNPSGLLLCMGLFSIFWQHARHSSRKPFMIV